MLRRCHKNCLHCSTGSNNDKFQNCTECYSTWLLTEDTSSCYEKVIDNYYQDGEMLRRCHKNCLHCSSRAVNYTFMNCLECYPNWYLIEETHSCYEYIIDNYYLDNNRILRRCNKNCYKCTTNEHNDKYMNCTECIPNLYLTEDTNSCYEEGVDNYYLDDNILRLCHKNCLKCKTNEHNDKYMNCTKCNKNLYMTEDTDSCYEEGIDNYYLDDNILKRCHPNCLQCYSAPKNNSFMRCKTCKDNFYLTSDTESCYDKVPDNYYLDDDNKLKRCHPNCLKCTSAPINDNDMNCKKCQKNFYFTEDTDSCYDYIPNKYYLDGEKLRKCYARCSQCLGAKNDKTMNCLGCINKDYFYKNDTLDCILIAELEENKTHELTKIFDYNFYIFIGIFAAAFLIFIINCIFYKVKKQKKAPDQEKEEKQTKKDLQQKMNESYEMENKSSENAINDTE